MGNEFGHPEWIDFPREGNGWSYHYCRRQWSLADNPELRYGELEAFDKEMLRLIKKERLLSKKTQLLLHHEENKILIYGKGKNVFAFNFHPNFSQDGYFVPVAEEGDYATVLATDETVFGGFGRLDKDYIYKAKKQKDGQIGFLCYLPCRTAQVFKKVD